MATDPLAMYALLEQLDQDLETGKNYPDQATQDQFFQQLITDTQLENRSKSGQGALHTLKSLREVLRYTLRGNKKAQYGPGGSDKKESQDALNHFFTIGSDMLKETYLAKLRAAVQKESEGTARPAASSIRRSNAIKSLAPAPQSTEGSRIEHGSALGAWKSSSGHQDQILSSDRPASFEPDGFQPTSQNNTKPGKRPGHDIENTRPAKRARNEHEPSRIVVLPIPKKSLKAGSLPTRKPRTEHVSDPPRFPYGLPTPSLSPPPPPPLFPQTIIYHQPLIGCISQAEILKDVKSITTAITAFLGTPQPSSPSLVALLGNGTHFPSSPNLSCSPLSYDSVWEWLIENVFSPNLASTSPFLGLLGDDSVQRAIATTKGNRVLSADAIVRELVLAQLRDPDFVIGDQSVNGDAWTKICQMAWRLKSKMSVSGEKFAIVRDRENGCTGVALKEEVKQEVKQEVKYVRDDGLERFRCL